MAFKAIKHWKWSMLIDHFEYQMNWIFAFKLLAIHIKLHTIILITFLNTEKCNGLNYLDFLFDNVINIESSFIIFY